MNISEHAAPLAFESLSLPEERLAQLRRALYHSSGPGYVIVPGFLGDDVVEHIRGIWPAIDPARTHKVMWSKEDFSGSCPDFYTSDASGNRNFYNFFFNRPVDEVTWSASLFVHMLRNRLSGRPPFAETFPSSGRSASYRVVITREATTWIKPHRDYMQDPTSLDRAKYDLTRLQATLFLSEKGRDYGGTGFRFERNDGTSVVFGTDVPVKAGDLVVWRYNNLHSIEDVSTTEGQLGFMRIIYPPEIMHPPRPYIDRSAVAAAGVAAAPPSLASLGVKAARGVLARLGLLDAARDILRQRRAK